MQKLFSLILIALSCSTIVSAQQFEKLFDKYMEDERFNYIYRKGNAESSLIHPDQEKMRTDAFKVGAKSTRVKENEKMLILNSSDDSFQKSFIVEINKALETDKFENTSFVRNGKSNRVSEYKRNSSTRLEEVQIIENMGGNIVLRWETYVIKSNQN